MSYTKLRLLMGVNKFLRGRNQGHAAAAGDTQPCRRALWGEVPLSLPWRTLEHHFQSDLKATEAQVSAAPGYN